MTENIKDYSENYFDSGEAKLGQYATYESQRFYPAFISMTKGIKALVQAGKVLDIGCAKGYLVDTLRNEGYESFGTDISYYAINNSPKHIRKYLSVCDLNKDYLPYPDSSFDLVICMGTLEYVENQSNAVNEISRILNNGGVLLMTSLNYVAEGDLLRIFARTEDEWNSKFKNVNIVPNKVYARKIISRYVKKIILYDYSNFFNNSGGKSVKFTIARLLFTTPLRYILISYLYRKQVKSGYLMLSYKKI